VGAYLAAGMGSLHAACAAAFAHGQAADPWPASAPALTASGLAVRCGAA
jgi:ADP-dependent NAD(P)H-hydrate dehydratase / NAD(P)H-hydrate epimerase